MSIIVDKESIKKDIIIALRDCLYNKTITEVSMRDIAKAAGISHSKIFYYFETKQQLFLEYVDYVTDLYIQFYKNWLAEKNEAIVSFSKPRDAIIQLIKDIVAYDNEQKSYALIQLFVMAQFDEEIKKRIDNTYAAWKVSITEVLDVIYHKQLNLAVRQDTAEAIQVILEGIFIFSLNHKVNDSDIEKYIESLAVLNN